MKYEYGCIHGRFQPFHNGHLEYFLATYELCGSVIVGITQYEADIDDVGSPVHRLVSTDNPFSYFERTYIIRSALEAEDVDLSRVMFCPFPIHNPSLISNYTGKNCIMFTTIYDEWNRQKLSRLRESGFETMVLWERSVKLFEGKSVRRAIRENFEELEQLVPKGTILALQKLGVI